MESCTNQIVKTIACTLTYIVYTNAKILFVGLAPAAHGGTRTGRVFTGDKSSDFLYRCL